MVIQLIFSVQVWKAIGSGHDGGRHVRRLYDEVWWSPERIDGCNNGQDHSSGICVSLYLTYLLFFSL